ncbi:MULTISPECIES: hypothetical protein [unclassified Streptomyces]|uniref:hypothetical protein n=1 Tax=unclassified Streptomyces TaxID=2593676 RepID=UPI002E297801|nr:hypothetical protein [Streptomyces sp. NBC_01429]
MTPRRPVRAARAAALLITALTLLSGCRIPSTGVVQVGEPATGVRVEIPVYLVLRGELIPVLRTGEGAPFNVAEAVALAFEGPTAQETRAGLTTELPGPTPAGDFPRTVVKGDEITIEVPYRERLGPLAARQLGCTAFAAHIVGDPGAARVTVTVAGPAGSVVLRPVRRMCPAVGQASPTWVPPDGEAESWPDRADGPSAIPAPVSSSG